MLNVVINFIVHYLFLIVFVFNQRRYLIYMIVVSIR